MRVFIPFLVIVFVLSGCMYHNLQNYGTIDELQKSVTVPPGSKGLLGKIKQVLVEQGWKLSVDRGPSVVEGELGNKTMLESYNTFNTRYRLYVVSRQYDICLNFQPAIIYDISFIDNQTGSEVFTIEGDGCENDAVDKFREAILLENGK